MGRFAKGTSVSCQKSRFEIETLVTKYGASASPAAFRHSKPSFWRTS